MPLPPAVPEFTIVDGEMMNESFVEPWTKLYPDPSARTFNVQLRYLATPLEHFTFVACDGERYRVPMPEPIRIGDEEWKYVISTSSTAWKISKIYRQYYSLQDDYALPGGDLVE